MDSECQRSILSCARCRRRKIKCGRQLPSCAQCIAARSGCTGIAGKANTTTDVPRSIVQHLESEIARLETELLQDGQLEVVHASNILLGMPSSSRPHGDNPDSSPPAPSRISEDSSAAAKPPVFSGLRASILSSRSLQAVLSATLPHGSGAADLLLKVRMGITPSSAKVGERRSRAVGANPKANRGSVLLHATVLRNMPWDIVKRLMRKYLNTIQPDNPFLVASTLVQQFENVDEILRSQDLAVPRSPGEDPLPVVANLDFLVVYLVLAISVTLGSANNGHEERCVALSVSLFEEGIQHFYNLPSFPSDIAWLQTILLVLLYATVFPQSANVWVLSGAAMRACLELGLHHELPDSMGLDQEALDLRRRVFWAAYCMDRSICSALQRPLSTPDAAINTEFPSQMQDNFLRSIAYHKLLSEMLHVHFHKEHIPPELTWEDWLTSMEERLRAWNTLHSDTLSHYDTTEFAVARGFMILHRPSPRVPFPSQRSLMIAFEAASTAERLHREHIGTGFFRRPWLSAHYTLEAATVVLFCLRYGYSAIIQRFTAARIFEMAKLLTSNFLAIATRGWPEVGVYAGVYERLLGPLLERVFLQSPTLSDRFGPMQDAELMRLLYPGPAHLEDLRFGLRRPQEDYSPFDFNLFLMDDESWDAGLHMTPDSHEEGGQHRWGESSSGLDMGFTRPP